MSSDRARCSVDDIPDQHRCVSVRHGDIDAVPAFPHRWALDHQYVVSGQDAGQTVEGAPGEQVRALEEAAGVFGDLLQAGFQPVLLHVLSPQELAPDLAGDLELIDSENGETVPASLTPETLARYRERLQTWCGELERYCAARRIPYVRLSTATPIEEAVLGELRRRRLLA